MKTRVKTAEGVARAKAETMGAEIAARVFQAASADDVPEPWRSHLLVTHAYVRTYLSRQT